MEKKEFKYGDIVKYAVSVDDDGTTSDSFGRIHAKTTEETAARVSGFFRSRYGLYVFVPWNFQNDEAKELIAEYGMYGSNFSSENFAFEWGELPKDKMWLFIHGDDLRHFVDEEMRDGFIEMGLCPSCGDAGYWKSLALFCKWHGRFM